MAMVYDLNSSYSSEHEAFVSESRKTLAGAARRVEHAIEQLSDDDLWWRPHPAMNAIGNLVLHVCGNLGQWVLSGVGTAPERRNRPAEFAARDPIAKADLLAQFRQTVAAVDAVIAAVPAHGPGSLLDRRRIQSYDTTVLAAIYHAISHLEGHAQEMIYIARLRRGDAYRFLWTPKANQLGSGA
jgi:hypothetical protein